MEITVEWQGRRKTRTRESTIEGLLRELRINSETVIVEKNGKIVPVQESLKDGDSIRIMKIISGG